MSDTSQVNNSFCHDVSVVKATTTEIASQTPPKVNSNIVSSFLTIPNPPFPRPRCQSESDANRKRAHDGSAESASVLLRQKMGKFCDIRLEKKDCDNTDILQLNEEKESSSAEVIVIQQVSNDIGGEESFTDKNKVVLMMMIKEAVDEAIKPLKEIIVNLNAKMDKLDDNADDPSKVQKQKGPKNPMLKPIQVRTPSYSQQLKGWGLSGQGQIPFQIPDNSKSSPYLESSRDIRQQRPPPTPRPSSNPAFSLARRCLGFYPITSVDIDDMTKLHPVLPDNDEQFQQIGKELVRQFLRRELLVSKRVAQDIRIKNLFYPKAGVVSGIMYAEFYSEAEVDILKRYTKNLQTVEGFRPKVIPYIPQSLYKRYKAVEEQAFLIRNNDKTQTTRIWIGEDFQLRVRERGSKTPWSHLIPETLSNLPPQDPRKPFMNTGTMDKQTPPTPMSVITVNPTQRFHSNNIFNFVGEVEA